MSAIFGELLNFPQENGPEIQLRVFDDERYARHENLDGYSTSTATRRSRTKPWLLCYSRLDGNQFVSAGVPVAEPPPAGIGRHVQESAAVKRAKAERRSLQHAASGAFAVEEVVRTFGPNQGLLSGRILSTGPVRGLTILGRNASELSIGTFCHENGHLLCRFPDMYDYGQRDQDTLDSAGVGHFFLMGAGNHLGSGRSPAPVCAYLRDLVGRCGSVVDLNVAGTYEARHGDYGVVMRFRTSKPTEYFLVENRSQVGLDRAGPANGLAVYHCDTPGSNELRQGTADRHYQCALHQADGHRDLFGAIARLALSSTSSPNSREWDGRESGLILSDVSAPGEVIRLAIGQPAPAVLHSRRGESQNDLVKSFDSDRPGELRPLAGQPMQGDWILRVADLESVDVGKVRYWSLEIDSASA